MESNQSESLVPELREAEVALETALAEACATKPPSEVDTGELIHMEEVLSLASEAAKRAISLRRKRRVTGTGRGVQAALTDAETAASPGAAHRAITDERGVRWDVFAVRPEPRPSPHSQLRGNYQRGWLCFDAGVEKRRFSPIPDDWQTITDQQLVYLSQRAEPVPRRRGRSAAPADPPSPPAGDAGG